MDIIENVCSVIVSIVDTYLKCILLMVDLPITQLFNKGEVLVITSPLQQPFFIIICKV